MPNSLAVLEAGTVRLPPAQVRAPPLPPGGGGGGVVVVVAAAGGLGPCRVLVPGSRAAVAGRTDRRATGSVYFWKSSAVLKRKQTTLHYWKPFLLILLHF
ncbi:Hypothetical predicted protein [Marmota monax]|uniref:Uncharacterized protein n=1 Tax=Marmota monax TaxID=9995 RepID=A0A5E4AJI0_MARMO|nr:hypothetical protein GHT09_020486 [Marmota monax]VTJ57474.1 Hypothetical predicted protein [Marmota monax]